MSSMEKVCKMFNRPNFPEHAKKTLSLMLEDSKQGLFCDVNLISGLDGKKFAAHRSVLSTTNDFFRTMFLSAFKEAEDRDVTLSNVSADILEGIINYCYTGGIEINVDNVQLLLPQAQLMLFTEIVEACSDFLQSLLNPANCISLYKYSKLYNCDNLSKNVNVYMQEHFLNVALSQEFLQLNEEEIKEYLSDDKLTVNNEKEVFKALIRWINYDQDSRISSLIKLLSVVRLHHIDTRFLLEYVSKSIDNQCILSALLKGVNQHLFNAKALPERTGSKPNRLVIVYQSKITVYNPSTSVIEIESSFVPNFYTSTLLDERVILVGQNKVQSFDLKSETFHDLATLQKERNLHAVAVLNGQIYVAGGVNENTVERWDAELNKWSFIVCMQQKREGACTAVLNNKLYVMGGSSLNDEYLNTVECYDPHTNKWSLCKSMVEKRESAKAAVWNGEIYVFGGRAPSTISCIEKYNPETDTWTKVAQMMEKRYALGACPFDNKIILFGGHNDQKYLTSMEEYDPITNKCKLIPTGFPEYEFKVDMFPYLSTN